MIVEIVALKSEHLDALADIPAQMRQAYFSPGSVALCLLADGIPVLAGGIVNLDWKRGEAWMLPTEFFRRHVKTCLREIRQHLPQMMSMGGFRRVQASCFSGVCPSLIVHLGFEREATLRNFGPRGETCDLYARFFEVQP